jgi:hypothetical protein
MDFLRFVDFANPRAGGTPSPHITSVGLEIAAAEIGLASWRGACRRVENGEYFFVNEMGGLPWNDATCSA